MTLVEKQFNFQFIFNKLIKQFFYSTLCYTCKKFRNNNDDDLRLCSGCKMISYCDREHQREHWPEHSDFCEAVKYVRETYKSELSACDESIMMEFLKEKVTDKLERRLKMYEVQMFKYPRMCFVCCKTEEVKPCSTGKAVWLCAQHKNNHDSNICDLLQLCLITDVLQIKNTPWLNETLSKFPSYEKEFSNMKEFISTYATIKDDPPSLPRELSEIKLSTFITKPLTVIYGMRVLDYIPLYIEKKTELVLHIIAAHISESLTLRYWEMLLHMFPNLKCLKVILIGPEVLYIKNQPVCDICNQQKKIFVIEWRDESYADYVQQEDIFKIPDLVIRFYIDNFYDDYYEILQSIWKSSLKYIAQHTCPFLLCYSRENNNIDNIINTELGKTIEYRRYENPFASLKPCRRMYDDDSQYSVYYDNRYINVYKSLCS